MENGNSMEKLIASHIQTGNPLMSVVGNEPEEILDTIAKAVMRINRPDAGPITDDTASDSEVPEADTSGDSQPEKQFVLHQWDIVRGLAPLMQDGEQVEAGPLAPLQWLSVQSHDTVLVLYNFHRFLKSIEVVQTILNSITDWKSRGLAAIIVAPEIVLPLELSKYVTIIDYGMPDATKLRNVMRQIDGCGLNELDKNEVESLVEAGMGLTCFELENALTLSYVTEGACVPSVVAREKAQIVKKSGCLEQYTGVHTFAEIGGHDVLKKFCIDTIKSPLSKGVLINGVPGTGKSMIAKALGTESSRVTLLLNIGRLFSSLIGSSEAQTRETLRVVECMAPCILYIDEIGRAFPNANSNSGGGDSGVSQRVLGTFLTWLEDRKEGIFFIATANNIECLPPEFIRRFDAVFFADLPTEAERAVIFEIHRAKYNVPDSYETPDTTNWTGAEIEKLCRISTMMGVDLRTATQYIVPLARSMASDLSTMREYAKYRCIATSIETGPATETKHRKVIPGSVTSGSLN